MDSSIFVNIILFVGAAQGFILSLAILFIKKGNRRANFLLSLYIIFFAGVLFFHSLASFEPPDGSEPEHNLFFAIGPLIYLYFAFLLDKERKFALTNLLHFLPLLFALFTRFIILILNVPPESAELMMPYFIGLNVIQIIIYFLLSLKLLNARLEILRETYSELDKVNISWLRLFLYSQSVIWPIALIVEVAANDHESWSIVWVLVAVFIYIIGYKVLRNPEIFSEEYPVTESSDTKKKYEKSSLNDELAEKYFSDLIALMQNEKPYLDPGITLPKLAEQISASHHHLSQIINAKLDQNFFEFINSYRVEEAKKMLIDPGKKMYTISAIAFDSGFNSLSSFNSVFKKFTEVTPSKFRENSES